MRLAVDTTPTASYKLIGPISAGEAVDIRCSDCLYCLLDVFTYLVFNSKITRNCHIQKSILDGL